MRLRNPFRWLHTRNTSTCDRRAADAARAKGVVAIEDQTPDDLMAVVDEVAEPVVLDIDAIEAEWLVQCGPCDYGLVEMGCACPEGEPRAVIQDLIAEIRRLRKVTS